MIEGASLLKVVVNPDKPGTEVIENAVRSVGDDLNAVRGLSVQVLSKKMAEPGAKALDGDLVGLIVAMSGAGALLPTALSVIRDWLVRQRPGTEVEIEYKDLKVKWSGATPPGELNGLIAQLVGKA